MIFLFFLLQNFFHDHICIHRLIANFQISFVQFPILSNQKYLAKKQWHRIYCYVSLITGTNSDENLRKELIYLIRSKIGPIATPDLIHFTDGLPKTRSGKIMRRILRKIAANEEDQLGDITTLADPSVVENLIKNKLNK